MTIPFYALIAMVALMVLTKGPLAVAMHRSTRTGYDNRTPRRQQAALTGWGERALAAHQNTIEGLPIFAVGVFISHLAGGPETVAPAAGLAITHTIMRLLYPILYIADWHRLRSGVWMIAYGCALGLAVLPIFV